VGGHDGEMEDSMMDLHDDCLKINQRFEPLRPLYGFTSLDNLVLRINFQPFFIPLPFRGSNVNANKTESHHSES